VQLRRRALRRNAILVIHGTERDVCGIVVRGTAATIVVATPSAAITFAAVPVITAAGANVVILPIVAGAIVALEVAVRILTAGLPVAGTV